jgi:carboxylesterase type B
LRWKRSLISKKDNGTDWYEHKYQAILQQTNCDSLTCLRNLPYEELYPALDNSVSGSWYPVIDGNIFPFHPSKLLSTGQYNHVPIIHGSTTDEGTDNAIFGIDTTSQLHSYLLNEIGLPFIKESPNPARIIDELLRYYPENPSLGIPHGVSLNYEAFPHLGKQYKRLAAIVGDIYYHSHVPLDARVYSKNAPTYIYRFDTLPWNPATNSTKMLGENGELVDSYKGVAHFSDIAYMFHNPQFHGEDPEHVEVADKMTDLWVSFVVDGVPSLSGAGVGREYIWDTYYDGRAKKHEGFGRTLVMRPSSKGGFVIEKDDYRVKERAYLARLMQEFNNIMEKS